MTTEQSTTADKDAARRELGDRLAADIAAIRLEAETYRGDFHAWRADDAEDRLRIVRDCITELARQLAEARAELAAVPRRRRFRKAA